MTEKESPTDAAALAGLRRVVVHARDGLREAMPVPKWTYSSEAWTPAQIQRYAKMLLALEALTLVADCLPADGGLSPDEASELRREAAEQAARMEAAVVKSQEQVARLEKQVGELKTEVEQGEYAVSAAYEELEGWQADVLRYRELAQKDVPAAIRAILEDAVGEEETPS